MPNRAEITPIEPVQVMLPRDIFSTTRIIPPFIRIKSLRMKYVLLIFSCLTWGYAQQVQDTIQSTIDLKEVTISALQATSETPVAYTNLTKKDLGQRNLGVDMPNLLQFLPGVVSTSDAGAGIGYTGIRVRGSDATRINVSINGIPYNLSLIHI